MGNTFTETCRPGHARHQQVQEPVHGHDNPPFRDFVSFLRGEVHRIGPDRGDQIRDYFQQAVALELAFFDLTYQHPFPGRT